MTSAGLVDGGGERSSGVGRTDLLILLGVVAVAAVLRLPNLGQRGGWDADQGRDMLVLWRLMTDHVVPLVGPPTSIGALHHGALWYLLLAPFAWISGDDPVAIMTVIAVGAVIAVAVTWWLARSIGGSIAGLAAGLLMAVSASAIDESTSIWNPNAIALSSSIALAAAWHAHQTGRVRWWIVAATALIVTMQFHVLGIALAPPLVALYLADLWRAPAGRRSGLGRAGLVAVGIGVLLYLPLIIHELGNGFPETRSVIAFLTNSGQPVALDQPARLLFVGLRIVAWPLSGLVTDHLVIAVLLGAVVVAGFAWRVLAADQPERGGVRFLAATLVFGWLVLGVGVAALTTVTPLPVDHYHAFLDPIVFVGAGLTVGALWQLAQGRLSARRPRMLVLGAVGAGLAGVLAFNLAIAPPAASPDGGWTAADLAAQRILMATAGPPIELRSLPAFKAADAYGFPLVWFHAAVSGTIDRPTPWIAAALASASGTGAVAGDVPPNLLESNGAIVTICDSLFIHDCGGPAEAAAVPASGFDLVLRFQAAPGRTISVYLPSP
jgi:4-amino-4-deoxy-L-arabinose transferase-like glycosyltransferase